MTEPIQTLFWLWYGAEEKEKIAALLELGHSLSLLALSPQRKDELLPDCIYCELLSRYFSSVEIFLGACSSEVTAELTLTVNELSQLLKSLPPEEAVCFSRSIFSLPHWHQSQELANKALEIMSWSEISKYEQ